MTFAFTSVHKTASLPKKIGHEEPEQRRSWNADGYQWKKFSEPIKKEHQLNRLDALLSELTTWKDRDEEICRKRRDRNFPPLASVRVSKTFVPYIWKLTIVERLNWTGLLADANLDSPLTFPTLDITAPIELAFTTLHPGFLVCGVPPTAAHQLTSIYSLRCAVAHPSLGSKGASAKIWRAEIRWTVNINKVDISVRFKISISWKKNSPWSNLL